MPLWSTSAVPVVLPASPRQRATLSPAGSPIASRNCVYTSSPRAPFRKYPFCTSRPPRPRAAVALLPPNCSRSSTNTRWVWRAPARAQVMFLCCAPCSFSHFYHMRGLWGSRAVQLCWPTRIYSHYYTRAHPTMVRGDSGCGGDSNRGAISRAHHRTWGFHVKVPFSTPNHARPHATLLPQAPNCSRSSPNTRWGLRRAHNARGMCVCRPLCPFA